jgi:very-short-patch-repair endonuclease
MGRGSRSFGMRRHQVQPDIRYFSREMRREPTEAEAILWEQLRGRRLNGWRFRRQHPYERFILDFYCADAKLIVEIDGAIHLTNKQQIYDRERTIWMEVSGFELIRFTNEQVLEQTGQVLAQIDRKCKTLTSPRPGTPGRGAGGEGLERKFPTDSK